MSTQAELLPLTHDDLVRRAVRWLRKTRGCGVVFAEMVTAAPMIPDAIGWCMAGQWSVLVEAKASRSDFFADRKKCHFGAPDSPGQERWYITPKGLVQPDELPAEWGLLECSAKRIVVAKICPRTNYVPYCRRLGGELSFMNPSAVFMVARARWEATMLCSALRRHQLGVEWRNTEAMFASAGVAPGGEQV